MSHPHPISWTRKTHRTRATRPAWSLVGILVTLSVVAGAPGIALAQRNDPVPAKAAAPALATARVAAASASRIEFGPPGPGMGWVTVNAPAGDKMQVYFDGRAFGLAPLTIYSIPKGDYVVEGAYPDGKQVSRPVTVDENAEATVDLQAGVIGTLSTATAGQLSEGGSLRRARVSKILLGVSAGALAVGILFGVLEMKDHSDYESAPRNQTTLDSLARDGRRDAMIANVSFVACGASLIAAAVTVLPPLLKKREAVPAETMTAFSVTPGPTRGSGVAGISMRF